MQGRSIRQMVSIVNDTSTVPTIIRSKSSAPHHTRERLIKPDNEQTRWLHNEVSQFTMKAIELAGGNQSQLARLTGLHSGTVLRMLNGELLNLRTIALVANRLGMRFTLVENKGE